MLFPNPWFDANSTDNSSNQPNTIQMFVETLNSLFNK